MSSKRSNRKQVHRSHSSGRTQLAAAMETRPWPDDRVITNTRDLVEDMPLAINESMTDPTMLDESDFEIDGKIDKLPAVESEDDKSDARMDKADEFLARNPFVNLTDGSPVEIVLIDRSKSKDSVRKLRIDEHMNVSYWNNDNKNKNMVVGIVIFAAVVLVTGLAVMLAGRNTVDHEHEYAMLVESMDMSIYRQAEPPAAGWDVWQVALPTPPVYINSTNTLMHDNLTSEAEAFTSVMSYTTYILVSEGHEERWMTSKSSVLLTFIKGSQVQIITNIFKDQALFSQETFYLGDVYLHGHSVYTTTQVVLPPEENFTLYIKITIAANGYHVHNMIAVQSTEDVVSYLLTEDDIRADMASLSTPQP